MKIFQTNSFLAEGRLSGSPAMRAIFWACMRSARGDALDRAMSAVVQSVG